MKKLTDIIEAAGLHPDALHVSHVKVDGQTKYKVKAVGKNLADGIKVGEHLTDSHLDDASEMGAKIKHIKEDVEQVDEKYNDKQKAMKVGAQVGYDSPSGDREPKADFIKGQAAGGAKLTGRAKSAADLLQKSGLKSAFNKGVKAGGDTKKKEVADTVSSYMKRNEEVEQIDEIGDTAKGRRALGQYILKATDSRDSNRAAAAYSTGPEYDKQIKTISKRAAGVGGVVKRLTKEDVEPEADMNILVQLRKPIDILEHGTQGGADITFGNGQKVFVEGAVAQKLVESMERIKPEDRLKVAEFLYQSHDNLMAVYSRLK